MNNKQKITKCAKQCDYLSSKQISQQVKNLLIQELKKKEK